MRFEVVAAVKIWIVVFWAVTPCSLVGCYQLSEEHNMPPSSGFENNAEDKICT
jgi:hypothetical protein